MHDELADLRRAQEPGQGRVTVLRDFLCYALKMVGYDATIRGPSRILVTNRHGETWLVEIGPP